MELVESEPVVDECTGKDEDKEVPASSKQAQDKGFHVDLERGAREVTGVLEARPTMLLCASTAISIFSIILFSLAMFANYGESRRSWSIDSLKTHAQFLDQMVGLHATLMILTGAGARPRQGHFSHRYTATRSALAQHSSQNVRRAALSLL